MIPRTSFCRCKDTATSFHLGRFPLTLLFWNSDLKGEKGLNRRHCVVLEVLYYEWGSEKMWMSLQHSQSCWTKIGPFENATVRDQQRTYNESVYLLWSYLKVCLDYKTINNWLLLWVRLKLPGNFKNPLYVQICKTTTSFFSHLRMNCK